MSSQTPDSVPPKSTGTLPPVPAKVPTPQPGPAPQRPGLPRAAGASPAKTAFDAAPSGTIEARSMAERTRIHLQASVRGVVSARQSAEELSKLISASPAAAAIAEHEGLGAETLATFLKLSEPFIKAFVPSAS